MKLFLYLMGTADQQQTEPKTRAGLVHLSTTTTDILLVGEFDRLVAEKNLRGDENRCFTSEAERGEELKQE